MGRERQLMNVLVLYGTTEGQTREIARFVADRLAARGHAASLVDAAEPELERELRALEGIAPVRQIQFYTSKCL